MYKNLEVYLEEIDHYLVVREGSKEILEEIKTHILEKAEHEFGEISEHSLEKVIRSFGSPRQVAEKYMDDYQIIAPSFKKYLFRYTGILFAFHFSLTVISLIFGASMIVFPFFYIPRMGVLEALCYGLMAFIFDLGLVGLFLYFVTQKRREMRLPWPKIRVSWDKIAEKKRPKPKIIPLILMLIGFGGAVFIYVRYNTLFFLSANFKNPESLLNPEASKWYSLALLVIFTCGILSYVLRFFTPSYWVDLVRNAIYLIILWIIINNPIKDAFVDFPYLDLEIIGNVVIIVLTVGFAISFVKSLIIIGRNALAK